MATVSSHTLNGADGTHAGGIKVRLVNVSTGNEVFVSETDAGGRLLETVDLTGADPGDQYELVFDTGRYWTGQGLAHSQRIDEIVLRFAMPNLAARYHMPIVLSPNSYSTWASVPE